MSITVGSRAQGLVTGRSSDLGATSSLAYQALGGFFNRACDGAMLHMRVCAAADNPALLKAQGLGLSAASLAGAVTSATNQGQTEHQVYLLTDIMATAVAAGRQSDRCQQAWSDLQAALVHNPFRPGDTSSYDPLVGAARTSAGELEKWIGPAVATDFKSRLDHLLNNSADIGILFVTFLGEMAKLLVLQAHLGRDVKALYAISNGVASEEDNLQAQRARDWFGSNVYVLADEGTRTVDAMANGALRAVEGANLSFLSQHLLNGLPELMGKAKA